jgi:hypothetical protein
MKYEIGNTLYKNEFGEMVRYFFVDACKFLMNLIPEDKGVKDIEKCARHLLCIMDQTMLSPKEILENGFLETEK